MTGRRTLGRVPWWALPVGGGLLWLAAAVGAAVAIGRAVRTADEASRVPQLDVPLWRGTDLENRAGRFAAYEQGLRSGLVGAPLPLTATLGGAIYALANSADEATARYWLAVCDSYGAPPELLRELWRGWSALHEHDPNPTPEDP